MSNVTKEDNKTVAFVGTTPDPMSESKEATGHVESASQILDKGCRHEQARTMVHVEVVDSALPAGPSTEHEEAEPDLYSEQQPSVTSELPSAAFGIVTPPRSPFSPSYHPSYHPSSPPYSPGSPRHDPNPPAYGSISPNFSQTSPPYSPSSPPYDAPGSSSSLSSSPQYGGGNSQSSQLIAQGSPTSEP